MSKRMVWEPLGDGYVGAVAQLAWSEGTSTLSVSRWHDELDCEVDEDIVLPDNIRLCRQVPATDAPVALPDEVREALDTVLTNCEVDMEMEAFDGDYAVQMAAAIKLLRGMIDKETATDEQ